MTSTQKPLLLLDVDGVLNAFQPVRPHVTRKLGGREVKGVFQPYTVRFDNEIVDMIDVLAEHYEIHWATMWNHAANREIAPALGIEQMPVLVCDHWRGWDVAADEEGLSAAEIERLWHAKTPLIPAYVGDRPFVWVDDDHSGADLRYLSERVSQDFHLLQPDAYTGLTWRDVAELVTWATELAAGTLVPAVLAPATAPTYPRFFDTEPVLYFDADDEMRRLVSVMDDEEK